MRSSNYCFSSKSIILGQKSGAKGWQDWAETLLAQVPLTFINYLLYVYCIAYLGINNVRVTNIHAELDNTPRYTYQLEDIIVYDMTKV